MSPRNSPWCRPRPAAHCGLPRRAAAWTAALCGVVAASAPAIAQDVRVERYASLGEGWSVIDGSTRIGPDESRIAWVERRDFEFRVVVDGDPQRSFEAVSLDQLGFAPDGRVLYVAADAAGTHVIHGDSFFGPFTGRVLELVGSGSGHVAWLREVREPAGGRHVAYLDGAPVAGGAAVRQSSAGSLVLHPTEPIVACVLQEERALRVAAGDFRSAPASWIGDGGAADLVWSDDGRRLAWIRDREDVRIMEGGFEVGFDGVGRVRGLRFRPGTAELVFGLADGRLFVDGVELHPGLSKEHDPSRWFSPDGRGPWFVERVATGGERIRVGEDVSARVADFDLGSLTFSSNGAAWACRGYPPSDRDPSRADTSRACWVVNGERESLMMSVESLVFDAAGRHRAYLATSSGASVVVVDGNARPAPTGTSLVLSPDGRRFGYVDTSRRVLVGSVDGDEPPSADSTVGHRQVAGLRFSPDSRHLVFAASGNDRSWALWVDGLAIQRKFGAFLTTGAFDERGDLLVFAGADPRATEFFVDRVTLSLSGAAATVAEADGPSPYVGARSGAPAGAPPPYVRVYPHAVSALAMLDGETIQDFVGAATTPSSGPPKRLLLDGRRVVRLRLDGVLEEAGTIPPDAARRLFTGFDWQYDESRERAAGLRSMFLTRPDLDFGVLNRVFVDPDEFVADRVAAWDIGSDVLIHNGTSGHPATVVAALGDGTSPASYVSSAYPADPGDPIHGESGGGHPLRFHRVPARGVRVKTPPSFVTCHQIVGELPFGVAPPRPIVDDVAQSWPLLDGSVLYVALLVVGRETAAKVPAKRSKPGIEVDRAEFELGVVDGGGRVSRGPRIPGRGLLVDDRAPVPLIVSVDGGGGSRTSGAAIRVFEAAATGITEVASCRVGPGDLARGGLLKRLADGAVLGASAGVPRRIGSRYLLLRERERGVLEDRESAMLVDLERGRVVFHRVEGGTRLGVVSEELGRMLSSVEVGSRRVDLQLAPPVPASSALGGASFLIESRGSLPCLRLVATAAEVVDAGDLRYDVELLGSFEWWRQTVGVTEPRFRWIATGPAGIWYRVDGRQRVEDEDGRLAARPTQTLVFVAADGVGAASPTETSSGETSSGGSQSSGAAEAKTARPGSGAAPDWKKGWDRGGK